MCYTNACRGPLQGALLPHWVLMQMEHLACYLPGNLALGVAEGAVGGEKAVQYASVAEELTHTCMRMYTLMPTGGTDSLGDTLLGVTRAAAAEDRFVDALQALSLPGLEVLGALLLRWQTRPSPGAGMRLARAPLLTHTRQRMVHHAWNCAWLIRRRTAGLAPEKITFLEEGGTRVDAADTGNVLRPETVESLYYMWRLTGEERYREWGWSIFQAFQEHAKGDVGYHSLLVHPMLLVPVQQCYALMGTVGCPGACELSPRPATAHEGRGEWCVDEYPFSLQLSLTAMA